MLCIEKCLDFSDQISDLPKEGSGMDKEDIEIKLGANMSKLWAFSCNLAKGKKVNCMAWNKVNKVISTRFREHTNHSSTFSFSCFILTNR